MAGPCRRRRGQGRTDVRPKSGLEEIFEEISPIEDFSGTMSLSFRDHRFEPPKNTVDECKERDVTYSAPLFVTAEFMNNETGEIKSQTVFMGDFPLMTDKGTFVINGTERVVVSQLVRSPGVYFERTPTRRPTRTSSPPRSSRRAVRGWSSRSTSATWSASGSTASASRTSPCCSRRSAGPTRRSWRSSATTSRSGHPGEGPHPGQDDALLDIYRKLRPGEPPTREAAQALLDNYYFNGKRYDLAKVGRYKINKKLGRDEAHDTPSSTIDDIVADDQVPGRAARGQDRDGRAAAARSSSRQTTSTTSATAGCGPSAS